MAPRPAWNPSRPTRIWRFVTDHKVITAALVVAAFVISDRLGDDLFAPVALLMLGAVVFAVIVVREQMSIARSAYQRTDGARRRLQARADRAEKHRRPSTPWTPPRGTPESPSGRYVYVYDGPAKPCSACGGRGYYWRNWGDYSYQVCAHGGRDGNAVRKTRLVPVENANSYDAPRPFHVYVDANWGGA